MAKRGIVHLDTMIGKFGGKVKQIKGDFEFTILGEEYGAYHVKFDNNELEKSREILKYILKSDCRTLD